jgi:hypothetical protein
VAEGSWPAPPAGSCEGEHHVSPAPCGPEEVIVQIECRTHDASSISASR